MKKLILILGGLVLFGCTPTVKKVALYRNKPDVVFVKKGSFYFSEEEKRFIRKESRRLGMRIPDSREIRKYMNLFLRNKKSLEIALRRANLYAPYIKPMLRKHGLPEELALLPLIESGFNPFAVSRSGAGGLWQLMPQTAKRYGLKIDSYVDERFDLYKSTEAAAKYLRYLYRMFGSWELVLAAYNCGEGCVKRRTGGVDFWRSKWALPDQTRKYVPMFFAALLIAESPDKYGLRVELENLRINRRYVRSRIKVSKFVKVASLKESTFRDLNPHIRGSYIPSGVYVYVPASSSHKTQRKVLVVKRENGRKLELKSTSVSQPAKSKVKKVVKERKIVRRERKAHVKSIVLKEESVRQRSDGRVIIRFSGEPFGSTKVLRLENGAIVYIKD